MLKILFNLISGLFMSKEQLRKEYEKLTKEKERLEKELKEKGMTVHYTKKDKRELEFLKQLKEAGNRIKEKDNKLIVP